MENWCICQLTDDVLTPHFCLLSLKGPHFNWIFVILHSAPLSHRVTNPAKWPNILLENWVAFSLSLLRLSVWDTPLNTSQVLLMWKSFFTEDHDAELFHYNVQPRVWALLLQLVFLGETWVDVVICVLAVCSWWPVPACVWTPCKHLKPAVAYRPCWFIYR